MVVGIFLGLAIILFIGYARFNNKYIKELCKYLMIALIGSSLLEVVVFNFRSYESILFQKGRQIFTNYTLGSGITCNNGYRGCYVSDEENAYIEFNNIDKEIKNIYLDFDGSNNLRLNYRISFTDDANRLYLEAGKDRDYVQYTLNSKYIRVHTGGEAHSLRINIDWNSGDFSLKRMEINKYVPIMINSLRMYLVAGLLLVVCFLRRDTVFKDIKYNHKGVKIVSGVLIILLAIGTYNLTKNNVKNLEQTDMTSSAAQYNNLARALNKGQFYLDLEVADSLKSLENPYDRAYRAQMKADYHWDYAYYNGKYYSYFGVVPCLITYLPYYMVTHRDLSNLMAITIVGTLYIIGAFYLIYQIVDKYFKKTKGIHYILFSLLFIAASGIISAVGCATFYHIPIISGIAFACLGLGFWLRATKEANLNKKYLLLGSLCMALVAGCRPQMLLAGFLAIIIFWDDVFKKRNLFSKKSIKETLCLVMPVIIVAVAIMYYNYARFGSPFDFGANYNLTTNDMTRRGFEFDRIFLGIYYLLFAPPSITPIFPFVEKVGVVTSYIGRTISERSYGGFFWTNVIAILGLFAYKFKDLIKDKTVYQISVACGIFAIIIIVADTQMAGVLPRYIADFAWLLMLSTLIGILAVMTNDKVNDKIKRVIIVLVVLCIGYNLLLYNLGDNLFDMNKELYYKLYYTFMFWL